MQPSENLTLPKVKPVTCNWCQAPVDKDKNYQRVQGHYFCGSHKNCLTEWLNKYYKTESGGEKCS